jgi:hypothetical protein
MPGIIRRLHIELNSDEFYLDGFISFVHVDLKGKSLPHGIEINPTTPEDIALQEKAKNLR